MDAAEAKQLDYALVQRSDILKRVGREAAGKGQDLGVSPGVWDGSSLSFDTLPLGPEEEAPAGWFRYGQGYWDLMRGRG